MAETEDERVAAMIAAAAGGAGTPMSLPIYGNTPAGNRSPTGAYAAPAPAPSSAGAATGQTLGGLMGDLFTQGVVGNVVGTVGSPWDRQVAALQQSANEGYASGLNLADQRALADLYARSQAGGGGGGGSGAGAFNAQRNAQVAAYGNQITDLEGMLARALENLGLSNTEQLKGIDRQQEIAQTETERQRDTGTKTIDDELKALLALLGVNAQAIAAEGEATTSDIRSQAAAGRAATEADYQRLLGAGGGRELAAARNEGLATSRNVEAIDAGLVQRLASAASADATRRTGSASQVADGANQELTNNVANILSQLAASTAQQRNQVQVAAAERQFELEQQYAQQISEMRLQQQLAAAQRFTGGGGGGGRAAAPKLNPFEQMELDARMQVEQNKINERFGLVEPAPEPTGADYFLEQAGGPQAAAAAAFDALVSAQAAAAAGDKAAADAYGDTFDRYNNFLRD